jgi:tetratricopeptide (TPR) repeat protein
MNYKLWCGVVLGPALLVVTPGRDALFASHQEATPQNVEAQKFLKDGVEAYKRMHTAEAIEDFQKAKELDPLLTKAQLFLATAYASQYIPGAPSPENIRYAEQAVEEFLGVLQTHPDNLSAIDGAGAMLYSMAGTPFNVEKMQESKSYHRKHSQIAPQDPEPYYWVGVIDWAIAFRSNQILRDTWAKKTSGELQDTDALPEEIREEFSAKYSGNVQEGIESLKKAMSLKPDYDDAMAYLNLLYRQKADMETNPAAREDDLKMADNLVDQVKAIKEKRTNLPEEQQ